MVLEVIRRKWWLGCGVCMCAEETGWVVAGLEYKLQDLPIGRMWGVGIER